MRGTFTFRPGPGLVTGFAVFGALWLGLWQLERLEWKEGLLAQIDEQQSRPIRQLPFEIEDAKSLEYRTFEVSGTFAHASELYLFATGPNGDGGYHIYTPLIRLDAAPLLINRGWVPVRARDPETRPEGQIKGQVRIRGIARLSRIPGRFTPANNAETNNWYYADLRQMGRALYMPSLAPVIIDADNQSNPGGLPLGGVTRMEIPNNHFTYALTWFLLALVAAAIYLIFSYRRPEKGRG